MTDQTTALLTTLRQRAADGYLWLGLVADELERLQSEVDFLRGFTQGLAYRVEAQSELLSRRAEKPL